MSYYITRTCYPDSLNIGYWVGDHWCNNPSVRYIIKDLETAKSIYEMLSISSQFKISIIDTLNNLTVKMEPIKSKLELRVEMLEKVMQKVLRHHLDEPVPINNPSESIFKYEEIYDEFQKFLQMTR